MATALQQQLAVIAAKSTQQLDLKAQHARHSKSLLFEPRDAASQTFDTIFQLCLEGFEELCMHDARFRPFARNIFSEQSKNEDRTQMTQQENDSLDKILESFLGLVGGRLLLKPAMKAVEWLVRRFRIQDYNTECVLLTFLPYHTSYIFPTLLSILPEQLPPTFRFLYPYVASLQSPPRHAIISAIVSTHQFFTAFSAYVLRVAKARHHSAILLGYWASTTAQAVNGMLDASRSGRDSIRQQREEDLLTRILPVLQTALSIEGVPELYIGSCMIFTILATKASLTDHVLDAIMEALVSGWTEQTRSVGLTCLAVIAEEKEELSQSATITRSLLKTPEIPAIIAELSQSHRVGRLATSTALGALDRAQRKGDSSCLSFASELLAVIPTQDAFMLPVLQALLRIASTPQDGLSQSGINQAASQILTSSASDPNFALLLQRAAQETAIELSHLQIDVPGLDAIEPSTEDSNGTVPTDTLTDEREARFESVLADLPKLRKHSFLCPDTAVASQQYVLAFNAGVSSDARLSKLLDLPALESSRYLESSAFLTCLARVWTNSAVTIARFKAIETALKVLDDVPEDVQLDLQSLLPYGFAALADPSQKVRRAASLLCAAISDLYRSGGSKQSTVWADGDI